jgi:acetate kinase
MYNDRVAKYIVQYFIELEGKVDTIVFTAGVGENGREARLEMLKKLAPIGIKIDEEVNDSIAGYKDINEGVISTEDSSIRVDVVPTNEEIMIIKDTYELVK